MSNKITQPAPFFVHVAHKKGPGYLGLCEHNNGNIIDMTEINGTIAGYDPGGKNKNGFAILEIQSGKPVNIAITTLANAEAVINKIIAIKNIIGLGVDTLSCWGTGHGGWRPADKWLRRKYPVVQNSIMAPNTLSGSMGINGMSVLIEAANKSKGVLLSETHPKVLYYALTQKKYDYAKNSNEMDRFLSIQLNGLDLRTSNDHEWDAAVSAYAIFMGITGTWEHDLHKLPIENNERILKPCGKTFYFWPNI